MAEIRVRLPQLSVRIHQITQPCKESVQQWWQCDYIEAWLLATSLKGSQHHGDKTTGLASKMSRAGSEWRDCSKAEGIPSSAMGCGSRSMTGNGVKWCAKRETQEASNGWQQGGRSEVKKLEWWVQAVVMIGAHPALTWYMEESTRLLTTPSHPDFIFIILQVIIQTRQKKIVSNQL
jgi:hypothetical protein